ncbi:MAG TPA: hypothetical protein VF417_04890, partial [Candidatus Methylomirabilis sp.]
MPRSRTVKTKPEATCADRPTAGRDELLKGLVEYLKSGRDEIRHAWVSEMARRGLARLLTPEEADAESARIYDALVECLETGRYHSAQDYAQEMAERDVFRGIGAKQVIGRLLVLRDVCARLICKTCRVRGADEACALDVY